MSLSREDLKQAVNRSIEYLKNRHHPEKPHISVLSPPYRTDYQLIWGKPPRLHERDRIGEEDEEELLEDVEETLRSRLPGWVMGADFAVSRNMGSARALFTFYVRVKPDYDDMQKWDDSAYTKVHVVLDYSRSPQSAQAQVAVRLEGEGGIFEDRSVKIDQCPEFAAVAVLPGETAGRLNRGNLEKVLERVASVGLGGRAPKVCLRVLEVGGGLLTASIFNSEGDEEGAYHHAFCAMAGFCGGTFKAYIMNLGGVVKGKRETDAYESPAKVYTYNADDGGSRWVLGHLLEVEGRIEFSGWLPNFRWSEHGLSGAYPVNTLVVEENEKGCKLRDYFVGGELLAPIKASSRSASDFLRRAVSSTRSIAHLTGLGDALSDATRAVNPHLQNFYAYQEEAISEILSNLEGEQRYKAIVIAARTAGGKTLAFLVPTIMGALRDKMAGKSGVKAILAYPTKALANDQLEEVAHLLFYLSQNLSGMGISASVSFGCLHGNTYSADEVGEQADLLALPVKCPLHKGTIIKLQAQGGKVRAACPADASCRFAGFLNVSMKKTRDEIYYDPPDILITDEDMLNRILSGYSKKHIGEREGSLWYEWQLLGYPYKRCANCRHTYPASANLRRCAVCGSDAKSSFESIEQLSKPYVIVLDEAHQLYGSFGTQVSHMLSLLEHAIGAEPLYVLSSATLGNAEGFAADLLGLNPSDVKKIVAEVEEGGATSPSQRIFAFIMPKAYTRDATLARLLEAFLKAFEGRQEKPKGIIFTNTLAESNEVLQLLRREFSGRGVKVDGHSTDYSEDRAEKELHFKEGSIDWFVATSTLELGVDYGIVDFAAIYGMPYKVTSFVQRMGRSGRARDAAVFVLFDSDDPVDHFYYENYKLLYDGALRDKAIEREVITVSRANMEAVKRATRRWAVSEVYRACSSPTRLIEPRLISVGLSDAHARPGEWQAVAQLLLKAKASALPESLRKLCDLSSTYRQLVDWEVDQIVQGISTNSTNWSDISGFVRFLGQDPLYDLRGADETVQVYFAPLGESRPRELRYAVRHYLKGQAASFRGYFFVVATIEPDKKVSINEWLEGGGA
jgi:superfamily II DNA/RNA helicase